MNLAEPFSDDSEDKLKEEDVSLIYALLMKGVILEIIKLTDPSIKIDENAENIIESIKSTLEFTGKVLNLANEAENISKVETDSGNLSDLIYIKIADLQHAIDENNVNESTSITATNELFKRYLFTILEGIPEASFGEDDIILTSEPDLFYLKQISKLIRETPPPQLEMYLWWSVIEDLILYTTSDLRHIYLSHVNALFGDVNPAPRSTYCASATNNLMGPAISSLFVETQFLEEVKPHVAVMLENIRSSFKYLVEKAEWMDNLTRQKTLVKLNKMKSYIGFPELVHNSTILDAFYRGVSEVA